MWSAASRMARPCSSIRQVGRFGFSLRAGRDGHAGVGQHPDPGEAAEPGVTDMLRITNGRMSGTGFGTVVLHVAPEIAVGGPLPRLRTVT